MRALILGAGNAGQRHAAAYSQNGVDFALFDKDSGDWKAAIAEADIVSVATPDNLHAEMTAFGLAKGKHVFCEKPFGHTKPDLDLIWDIARQVPGTLSCNLPLRHVPEYADMIAVTAAERRGPLYLAEAMYSWGRWEKMQGWRGEIPGYSIVAGGGMHVLDLMIQATGHTPTEIEAKRSGKRAVAAVFRLGTAVGRLTVNFGFTGAHRTGLSLYGERDFDSVLHAEAADFGPGIRRFLEDIQQGRKGNGMEAMKANRAALAIEEACR